MFFDVALDGSVIADASGGEDVGNAVNGTGSHEADIIGWVEEGDLAHIIEVKIIGKVGESF